MILGWKCYLSFHNLGEGMSVNIKTNTKIWTYCLSYWQETGMGSMLRKTPSAPEADIYPVSPSSPAPHIQAP